MREARALHFGLYLATNLSREASKFFFAYFLFSQKESMGNPDKVWYNGTYRRAFVPRSWRNAIFLTIFGGISSA
ncbi:MAG TPA: hypothetical protein H9999_07230, partial [Candidatus Negativibacillus faecipullorum]|nr:hypothetical protein [Candidatus Negativibacillus faecipullorum]